MIFLRLFFNFDFYFFKEKSLLILKNPFGFFILHLSFLYFFDSANFSFFFSKKIFWKNFLSRLFFILKNKISIFFFKIKSRGLGYRIRSIWNTKYVFRFFFGGHSFVYFFQPKEALFRVRKRYLLTVSPNYNILRLIFVNLLFLRKLIPYNLRGVFFPKQIVLLKPGKKTF